MPLYWGRLEKSTCASLAVRFWAGWVCLGDSAALHVPAWRRTCLLDMPKSIVLSWRKFKPDRAKGMFSLMDQSPETKATVKRWLVPLALFAVALFSVKGFAVNQSFYIGKSAIPAATTDYLWVFFALVLWRLMTYGFVQNHMKPHAGEIVFGLLFGVANFVGTSLFAFNTLGFIGVTMPWYNAAIKCLGQGIAMTTALTVLSNCLGRRQKLHGGTAFPYLKRLRAMYRAHTVLVSALFFWLCWLPYMIAFFPGTVIYDMCVMVRQFFGLEPMTTWHSVFTTCLFGSCIWIGRLFGSDNFGSLLYMLIQSVALAFALGGSMRAVRRMKIGRGWQLGVLAFYGFAPIWGYYCMMIGKDTLYTAMLMLFLLQSIELARMTPSAPIRPAVWIRYAAVTLAASLLRNNGLYVVLASALAVVLVLFRGRMRLRAGASLLSALMAAALFTFVAIPALGVIDDNFPGFHYVMFQQTARTLRDHADEVTEEEKAVINTVLDADAIGGVYEPWIADPVRNTFRLENEPAAVQQQALADYRKVWWRMLPKYPDTYWQAFIANNSGYYAFTPFMEGITYLQQAGLRFVFQNYWEPNPGELHTVQPAWLDKTRALLTGLATRWRTLPVLSLLYVLPVYTWLTVGAGIALAHRRRWRELALFVPALASFAVCIVSPVNDYLRYFLPIVAMTPVLLALAHSGGGGNAKEHTKGIQPASGDDAA